MKQAGTKFKLIMLILFLAIAGTMIGLGIAGLCYSTPLHKSYDKFKCSLFLLANEAIEGASDYSGNSTWIGIEKTHDFAATVINELGVTTIQSFTSLDLSHRRFSNTRYFLDDTIEYFVNGLNKIHTPAGERSMEIFSKLYATNENPLLIPLHEEMKYFESDVVNAMDGAIEEINYLENHKGIILSHARNTIDKLKPFAKQAKDLKEKIYDYSDFMDAPIKYVNLAFSVYYGFILGCITTTVIGVIFSTVIGCPTCRCSTHLGWILLLFSTNIGFVLTALLFPFSVALIETCDVITLDNLKEDHGLFPDVIWKEIGVCLTGDGDLYKDKKLNSLDFARKAARGIETFRKVYDTNTNSIKYPARDKLIEYLDNVAANRLDLACPSVFTTDYFRLFKENNCRGDTADWSSMRCSKTGFPASTLLTASNGVCFPAAELTPGDGTTRYGSYSGCTSEGSELDALIKYADDVKNYIKDLKNILLKKDPSSLALPHHHYTDAMDKDSGDVRFIAVFLEFKAESSTPAGIKPLNLLVDLGTKFPEMLNCSFMKGDFNRIHSSLCGNFSQSITSMALFAGLTSSLSILLITSLTCINRNTYKRRPTRLNKD